MKLLIMVPAYNEALNIRQVVQHLQSICPEYDYLIINDGSRDATARICRENRYPVLDLPVNGGLSNAIHAGMCYAKERAMIWRCNLTATASMMRALSEKWFG